MKILSFSAVEILPSLLDKSKIRTIRPLWKSETTKLTGGIFKEVENTQFKKPRFKVGDKVKLMWKQRSKYNLFCPKCGRSYQLCTSKYCNCNFTECFPKLLGTGTITEMLIVEMLKTINGFFMFHYKTSLGYYREQIEIFAKEDGFRGLNPVDKFFNYFDNHYDLSTPKPFQSPRWRWD